MAILLNDEKNISVRIELVDNESTDIEKTRPDSMNWIPFNLLMSIGNSKIMYSSDVSPTFCISELKYLIGMLKKILEVKKNKKFIDEPFKFISKEYLFELTIYETKEEDLVYVDWWFNMGSLTNGQEYGYSKGFRFTVTSSSLSTFVSSLENEFYMFLQNK